MNSVQIKKASLNEFNEFYTLFEKTLDQQYFIYSPITIEMIKTDLPKKSIREGIKKGNRILFLAYIEDKLAGYLLTNKVNGGVAFGHWLAVERDNQKKGIGTALLKFWLDEALKQGAHMVELYTTKNNIEFYIDQGFILAEGVPGSWFGVDHFHFYKTLRKFDEDKYFKVHYIKDKKALISKPSDAK